MINYEEFLKSPIKDKWESIGIDRRAGVCTPLFSIYSKSSIGIGEIPDLKLLVNWCVKNQLSIIQLLPINDSGFNNSPYDAQSSFGIDPVYLSIENLQLINAHIFKNEITFLKEKYNPIKERVNYEIKNDKLKLLFKIFSSVDLLNLDFIQYKENNKYWINDYAKFKSLKENYPIDFYIWLQYELYKQLINVKEYANKNNVLLMGDIPFLVSKDSADVYFHEKYFKLNLASGAPPDAFNDKGQRWGMPPYNWEEIKKDNYIYLKEKLSYAENFYNMFRIDHFIGIFRIWTIDINEPIENQGLNGKFDPEDENLWEEHGRNILNAIVNNTIMLPCAEDLGVVPEISFRVLHEYCIPGIEIQRWKKDNYGNFINESEYRKNSICSISTHDMASFISYFEHEINGEEKNKLFDFIGISHGEINFEIIRNVLLKAHNSSSIFSIQLLQDYLSLTMNEHLFRKEFRINIPGTVGQGNWSVVMPFSLEEMMDLEINPCIKELSTFTYRK